jgi:microcystin-dependent protein
VNTFKLPDLRGRSVYGQGQGAGLSMYTIGSSGGYPTSTLIADNLPAHTHGYY